jgi:hypothetical protein
MESSRHQATLGKKALGIIVTDMNGNRISFARQWPIFRKMGFRHDHEYRLPHGRVHGKEAGVARYPRRVPGGHEVTGSH